MAMGRKRKNNPLGLPDRVYANHGAFYYVHRDGRWENLGTDVAEAKRKGHHYNDPTSQFGTMAWYLDEFGIHCQARVKAGDLAIRTCEDYLRDIEAIKTGAGNLLPSQVNATHKAQYLDLGQQQGRPVRANREVACWSACLSWMARTGAGGISKNPFIGSGVRRNKETKRERYVEDHELLPVRALAGKTVMALLDLVYRTLQRPEDILGWTQNNLVKKREPDGTIRRVIRNKQCKTGAVVEIAITSDIESILADLKVGEAAIPGPGMPIIHTQQGKRYTYDGLSSMLKRHIAKAQETDPSIQSFGFYDLKAKGATDMWLAGSKLEMIQVLCGHDSVTTTEIYVKCRWRGTVQPNQVVMAAK